VTDSPRAGAAIARVVVTSSPVAGAKIRVAASNRRCRADPGGEARQQGFISLRKPPDYIYAKREMKIARKKYCRIRSGWNNGFLSACV